MEIKEIQEKGIWDNFFDYCNEKTFLQSWEWGEFQKKMGNRIWRLGVFDGKNLAAVALALKIKARRGVFLLVPHGPSLSPSYQNKKLEVLKIFLERFEEISKKEKCSFIRIVPLIEKTKENEELFRKLGFRRSPIHASAYEATWRINISLSEGELLKNMRKTTRYLIRQTLKNPDISIKKSKEVGDVKIFWELTEEAAKRQKFVPFSYNFIRNEFEVFSKDNSALLIFGRYKNEISAGALIIFWSGIAFYHQAASRAKYAKFSIPYLVLWEAIKEAKARECQLFDFWGYVDIKKQPTHPWAGPTLFKMGFGGGAKEYVGTLDFIVSKKYWLTFLFEKIRKIKRGL